MKGVRNSHKKVQKGLIVRGGSSEERGGGGKDRKKVVEKNVLGKGGFFSK